MHVAPQGKDLQYIWNKCTSLQQNINIPNSVHYNSLRNIVPKY